VVKEQDPATNNPTPPDLSITEKSTIEEKIKILKNATREAQQNISTKQKPFSPWKTSNKTIKEFSVNPAHTPWVKLYAAENKITKKRYIRLRKFKQNFNITSPELLTNITKTAYEAANLIGWKKTNETQTLKYLDKISDLRTTIVRDQEKIRDLSTKLAQFRIMQLNADIPRFQHDLHEFDNLLKNPHREDDIQQFLEKNTWLFGAEYLETQPVYFSQLSLSDSRFDFLLQRYDTFYDIVEIKRADAQLLNRDTTNEKIIPSRDVPFSSDLKNVISQMIGYLELVVEKKKELSKQGIFIHKPKGKIIIGRALSRREQKAITTIGSYLNQIEIMTYDDLLKRGEIFVETIKNRRTMSI